MDNRLKERLTGAAILVALVVLLVPEIFSGRAVPGPGGNAAAEAPPVRSYVFHLTPGSDQATGTVPLPAADAASAARGPDLPAAAARSSPAASGGTAGAVAATSSSRGEAAAQPVVPHTAIPVQRRPRVPSPLSGTAEGAAYASGAEGGSSGSASQATSESRSGSRAAASEAEAASPAASGKSWVVQLGVFSQRSNAQRLVRQVREKGVAVTVTELPGARHLYRVHSTERLDRDAAEQLARRLKADGFGTSVMRR